MYVRDIDIVAAITFVRKSVVKPLNVHVITCNTYANHSKRRYSYADVPETDARKSDAPAQGVIIDARTYTNGYVK